MSLMKRLALPLPIPGQSKFTEMPYDKFCPKVAEEVKARTCAKCGIYYPSVASTKRHYKSVHQNDVEETQCQSVEEDDCEEEGGASTCMDGGVLFEESGHDKMPVYKHIFDAMQCPWVDE